MAVFQRIDHLTSSSKPAGSSEVYKVTKEGAPGDWLLSKVADFVFSRAKKSPRWNMNIAEQQQFNLGSNEGGKNGFSSYL